PRLHVDPASCFSSLTSAASHLPLRRRGDRARGRQDAGRDRYRAAPLHGGRPVSRVALRRLLHVAADGRGDPLAEAVSAGQRLEYRPQRARAARSVQRRPGSNRGEPRAREPRRGQAARPLLVPGARARDRRRILGQGVPGLGFDDARADRRRVGAALDAHRGDRGRDARCARRLRARCDAPVDRVPAVMTGFCLLRALAAVTLGLFVWTRAPRHAANLAFAWGMLWLAAADIAAFMLTRVAPAERNGWLAAALVGGMLMLPGWAVFGVTFARPNPADEMRRWRWPLAAVAVLAALALAAALRYPFTADPTAFGGDVVPLTTHAHAVVVVTLLVSVLVLFELESTFRGSAGTARWRIKYLLLGLVGLFGVRIFVLSDVL